MIASALIGPLLVAVSVMGQPNCNVRLHTDSMLRYRQARADPVTCTVYLNRRWRGMWRPELCTAVAHELGHLNGRLHSSDPYSIMNRAPRPLVACLQLYGFKGTGPHSNP